MIYANARSGWLYLAPFLVGLAVFTAFPFVASLLLSFSDYRLQDSLEDARYIGLAHYVAMAGDRTFHKSLGVTFLYVFVTVPLKLATALGIAMLLNFRLRGIGFFRTAFYLPSILGGSVAIAVVWRYAFAGDGLVNQAIGWFGAGPVNWLGEPGYAMASVMLLRLWQFGSAMVIFLAGLKGIPQDLCEAARLDGAGHWQLLRRITLPLLTPVIFFNFVMQVIQAFQEFNGPYIITAGGPLKSTYLLPLMIYEEAFKYFDVGYASALSWLLFLIVGIFSALAFRSSKYWVFYSAERETPR
ncbi:MAG TPA: sugar ABC transporter permease [Steroidobacteraceae bacterium]|nr:sugar ABC transporter permease [Steroidobacteraceae bacterium]